MSEPDSIASCLADGARRLSEAGVPDARREARLILAHSLGIEPVAILGYPERPVDDAGPYQDLIARRAAREPLSHLTGRREFWSLEFEVTPATLDPRADSETLVEAALAAIPDRQTAINILDFGVGTGCLLLALLSERPSATGVGVDIDEDALAVARRNATRLGFSARATFVRGDWGESLAGPFDLIIANPPYIPAGDIASLQPEVAQYEPRRALDGGPDGLAAYRRLGPEIVALLKPGGLAVLEFGVGQGVDVAQLMSAESLMVQGFSADLAGHDRCLTLRKP
jgi:release factor glutamine methyltransferase